jgi:hypothetical protein
VAVKAALQHWIETLAVMHKTGGGSAP